MPTLDLTAPQQTRLDELRLRLETSPRTIWLIHRYRTRTAHTQCVAFKILHVSPAIDNAPAAYILISIGRDVAFIAGLDYDVSRDGVIFRGRDVSPAILIRTLSRAIFKDADALTAEWI